MRHSSLRLSLRRPPKPVQRLPFPVLRVRVSNEMPLLVKIPMTVKPNDLGEGQRAARIERKMVQLEHDCNVCHNDQVLKDGLWTCKRLESCCILISFCSAYARICVYDLYGTISWVWSIIYMYFCTCLVLVVWKRLGMLQERVQGNWSGKGKYLVSNGYYLSLLLLLFG